MKVVFRMYLFIALVLNFSWTIDAQEMIISNDLRIRNYQLKDGLPSLWAERIIQDSRGIIWIGTYNGLVRFDGYEFETILPGKIGAIFEDSDGFIWVGTNDDLIRLDPKNDDQRSFYYRDKKEIPKPQYDIVSLTQDKTGAICVGTAKNGLIRLLKNSSDGYDFLEYPSSLHKRLRQKNLESDSIAGRWIWQMLTDVNGNTFLGTFSGFQKMILPDSTDPGKCQFKFIVPDHVEFTPGDFFEVQSISPGTGDHIWIIAAHKSEKTKSSFNIYKYTSEHDDFVYYSNDLNNNSLRYLLEDEFQNIWLGQRHDPLHLIEINEIEHLKPGHYNLSSSRKFPFVESGDVSIGGNNVQGLMQDGSVCLWVLSNGGGLYQFSRKLNLCKYYELSALDGLENQAISGILPLSEEELLITTWRNGIIQFNINSKEFTHFHKQSNPSVPSINPSIFRDAQNRIWIGSNDETLLRYHPEEQRFSKYKLLDQQQYFRRNINLFIGHISESQNGNLWMGSYAQGLIQFDPDEGQMIKQFSPDSDKENWILDNAVLFTHVDMDDQIWFGTLYRGMQKLVFDEGSAKFESYLSGFTNLGKIISDDKYLWIGSFGQGLIQFDRISDTLINTYGPDENLPSLNIWDMWKVGDDWIWLITANGLIKYNPIEQESIIYAERYGIEFSQRLANGGHLRDGKLYAGGEGGFYVMDLETEDNFEGYAPSNIILEEIAVNHDSFYRSALNLDYLHEISLKHNQNSFTIRFTGIQHDDPLGIDYRYKLTPYQKDWQEIGNSRIARFSNIPDGNYQFKVQASNRFGSFHKDIGILIQAPWWRSVTAYVSYLFLLSALIWFFLRLYFALQKEKLEKEQEQSLRTLRSRFFTNISHEFKTPLTLLQGPIQDKRHAAETHKDRAFFQKLEDQTLRMSRLVSELVDLAKIQQKKLILRNSPGNVMNFLKLLADSFDSMARHKKIDYSILLSDHSIEAEFDRDQLEKIVVNLLSNAFNHTPEDGVVEFKSYFENSCLNILVRNTGIPIPRHEIDLVFNQFYQAENATRQGSGIGLTLINELVNLMKGQIEVDSNIKDGTVFRVKIPLTLYKPRTAISESSEPGFEPGSIMDSESNSTILIVEDNLEIATYIASIFEETFQIHIAENGTKGLTLAETNIPDIIISDIMMPEMDGIEFCNRIKTNLKLDHIPIVLLTAKTDVESRIAGLRTGADHYISKPFNSRELKLIVQNIYENRKKLFDHYNISITSSNMHTGISVAEKSFIENAVKVVENRLDNPEYSIEDFAKDLFLSRTHLYKKVKSITGQNPSQFVRNIRLEHAARLLKTNGDNISRVAYDVGFNNLSYFTKCFKDKYGVPPKKFLNS